MRYSYSYILIEEQSTFFGWLNGPTYPRLYREKFSPVYYFKNKNKNKE